MEKYQVKYKLINTETNNVICESVLYSIFNPKNRVLFNSEDEAHSYMKGIEKSMLKQNKNINNFKLKYELYNAKIKLK